jgi:hypothetical protein
MPYQMQILSTAQNPELSVRFQTLHTRQHAKACTLTYAVIARHYDP